MLESILVTNAATGSVTFASALLCTLSALILGVVAAAFYAYHNTVSKNFVVALALLPAMVQVVILMVNGNLGTGVAVLGAFSLIRFRSVPGSAREIAAIFLSMAIGLAAGMGCVWFAAAFTVLLGAAQIALSASPLGNSRSEERDVRISIPENLDYTGLFDDVLAQYTTAAELQKARTVNMGSMYELIYRVTLRDKSKEKAFLDALRCRNGNLTVSCGRVAAARDEL